MRDIYVVDLETLVWLRSPQGREVLSFISSADDQAHERAARGDASAIDPLRIAQATAKAFPDLDRSLAAAALTQVQLRRIAAPRLGELARDLIFTRDGLEQASRTVVAHQRAARLVAAGTKVIADLGCGLGLDSITFAKAGLVVRAVERDPLVAAIAQANADAAGVGERITVHEGDLTDGSIDEQLTTVDTIFIDPARRDVNNRIDGRSQRTLDPQQWSPPWSWVAGLGERTFRIAVKVAPGIPHELTPDGGCTTWTSVDGDLVEAEVVWPGLNTAGKRRRAVVIRHGEVYELTSPISLDDEPAPPVGEIGNWISEPDDAVIRSGLIATLAEQFHAHFIDPHVAYLATDNEPTPSPFMASFRVDEVLPYRIETLRAALIARRIGHVVVKKRAINLEPDVLRKQLRLPKASGSAVVIITRIGTDPWAFICTPQSATYNNS